MADNVLMAFGDFKFLIGRSSYNSLSQKISFKWTSLARLRGRPALHFDSIGDETISISGEVFRSDDVPEPRDLYRQLRELGSQGRAQVLVDQEGIFYGKWVLEDLDMKQEEIAPDSRPRRIDFSMTLKRYGEA